MLYCPKCHTPLKQEGRVFRCSQNHCFDQARQGYVNLLIHSQKAGGDNKEMVRSRSAFLRQGYYNCLKEKLIAILRDLAVHTIVDAGCGEGYYTNAIQQSLACAVYGFDVSKFALMRAARENPQARYAAASVFDLPLADSCCDLVLSVFAPVAAQEARRVLQKEGWLLKVEPGARHLWELKRILYEQAYENETQPVSYEGFRLAREWLVEDEIELRQAADIQALFQMTPYYYRSPRSGVERLAKRTRLRTRIQFHIELYQKEETTG